MKINIPTPCTEDTGKMSPTERGRFCFKCEKEVIDFRNKSSEEIKHTLLENSGKQVCGTILQSQMDDFNSDVDQMIQTFRIHPFRLRFFAMIVVFGTTLFSCQDDHVVGEIQTIGKELIEDSTKTVEQDFSEDILGEIATVEIDSIGELLDCKIEMDSPPIEMVGEIVEFPDTNTCEKKIDFDDVTVVRDLFLQGDVMVTSGAMVISSASEVELPIRKNIEPKLILYPNPAVDNVNLRLEDLASGKVQYKIVDATGKLMTANSFEWDADDPRAFQVDVSSCKPGAYFVTIVSGDKKLTEQLVVQ